MIIIENLCKAYNDKILFKNFHLEIPDSSFLVISGESGCGKSTLLNMIGGIETPDKGSIIVNGFDVTKKGKKQKYFKEVVGFLFQNFALLENKTVKENLEIIKKSGRTDILINEALEKVGLQKVINKKVYQLSGGEWGKYITLQEKAKPVFLSACAMKWNQLQNENAPLRAMLNGKLQSVSEDIYDSFILREIAEQPEQFKMAIVIGNVLGKYQLGISDVWISNRIDKMLEDGVLEIIQDAPKGETNYRRILRKRMK